MAIIHDASSLDRSRAEFALRRMGTLGLDKASAQLVYMEISKLLRMHDEENGFDTKLMLEVMLGQGYLLSPSQLVALDGTLRYTRLCNLFEKLRKLDAKGATLAEKRKFEERFDAQEARKSRRE
jgi:hypothetical protein